MPCRDRGFVALLGNLAPFRLCVALIFGKIRAGQL